MSNKAIAAIVGVIILLAVAPLVAGGIRSAGSGQAADRREDVSETAAHAGPRPRAEITQSQFAEMRSAMTYADCVRATGVDGEPASAGATPENGKYVWHVLPDPPGGTIAGDVTLTFRDGVKSGQAYSSKSRPGGASRGPGEGGVLPRECPSTPPYICQDVYDRLTNGTDYAACVRLLGSEGAYEGQRTLSFGRVSADGARLPSVGDVYVWRNAENSGTLTLSFQNGKLVAREASGKRGARGSSG